MLNIRIGNFNDNPLEMLSGHIKRKDNGEYIHEYVCINIRTFKRYKISFETEHINANFIMEGSGICRPYINCSVKVQDIDVNIDDEGCAVKIQELDWDK